METKAPIFRDNPLKPVRWCRDSDKDIDCPLCVFEGHTGVKAFASTCIAHPHIPSLIGTQVYHCPRHQREVHPLLMPGYTILSSLGTIITEVIDGYAVL